MNGGGPPTRDFRWFDLELQIRARGTDLRAKGPVTRPSAAALLVAYGGLSAVDPDLREFVRSVFPLKRVYTLGCCQGHPEGGRNPAGFKRQKRGFIGFCSDVLFPAELLAGIAALPGVHVHRWPRHWHFADPSITISFTADQAIAVSDLLLTAFLEFEVLS